ncbi:MAG: DUF255 domain-containing protein [bacterium]
MEKRAADSISWQAWSNDLFAQAKSEDKPVFLYLQAPWCQWCRRLESESLTDPQICLLINRYFIPLRVDSDERPDINLRYTMGGWPSIAILTPDGEIITGGTFLNREDLKKLLTHCLLLYREHRKELRSRLRQAKKRASHHVGDRTTEETGLSLDIVHKVLEFLSADFDPIYGGFGREPKFPHYEAIELALCAARLFSDSTMEEIATRTLDGMAEGELFDREEGGFFRLAQKRDWSAPQTEKMLVDNAWLLHNYLDGWLVCGQEKYRDIARSVARYLDTHLYDPGRSVFFPSQRADEEYYRLSRAERKFFPPPSPQKTIYTDWNALAVSAFLKASAVFEEESYLERARKTLAFLWQHCFTQDAGMLHAAGFPPDTSFRLLADQIYMARALLDTYQILGEEAYLSSASLLAQLIHRNFSDEQGGFWDRTDTDKPCGRLRERIKPILDNALAAEFFLKLGILDQNPEYLAIARHTLAFFSQDFPRYGIFASHYALACYLLLQPAVLVIILGRQTDQTTRHFLGKAFALSEPRKIIKLLELDQHPQMLQMLQQQGYKAPRGYLYLGQDCLLETDDIEHLVDTVRGLAGK